MRNDLGIPGKTFRVNAVGGVARRRVVAKGPGKHECQNVAGANAGNLAGVTLDAAASGEGAPCHTAPAGYAEMIAAGPIARHSRLNTADVTGRVKAVNEVAGTVVVLCGVTEEEATAAGDIIMVDMSRFNERDTA